MSIGSYDPHRRYQERAAQRLAGMLKVFAFIVVSLVFGFWLGKQYAAEQLIISQDSVEKELIQNAYHLLFVQPAHLRDVLIQTVNVLLLQPPQILGQRAWFKLRML